MEVAFFPICREQINMTYPVEWGLPINQYLTVNVDGDEKHLPQMHAQIKKISKVANHLRLTLELYLLIGYWILDVDMNPLKCITGDEHVLH